MTDKNTQSNMINIRGLTFRDITPEEALNTAIGAVDNNVGKKTPFVVYTPNTTQNQCSFHPLYAPV